MVPDRFARKVMVLVVPGMAVAKGGRRVSRSKIQPASRLGEMENQRLALPWKTQFISRLRSWQPSDFPLFLWLIRSPCALF